MSHTSYKLELSKTLIPIKNSKWYYLQSTISAAALLILTKFTAAMILAVAVFFGFPIVLQAMLHINYYFHDRKIKLTIDYEKRLLIYENGKRATEIHFSQVKTIKRYQGSKYPNPKRLYNIPSSFYHYNVIQTEKGKSFKFTDFVKGDIGIYGVEKKIIVIPFLNLIM